VKLADADADAYKTSKGVALLHKENFDGVDSLDLGLFGWLVC